MIQPDCRFIFEKRLHSSDETLPPSKIGKRVSTIYITFLIGNGFDINLGLRTRYLDFYDYFLKNAHEENMIRNWIAEEEYLWSDLEKRLGEKTKCVEIESVDQFYEDKIELDRLLMEYLEEEQKRFVISDENISAIKSEFERSIKNITEGFSNADEESFKGTMQNHRNEVYEYNFITYNYTDVFDRLIEMCIKSGVDVGKHTNTSGNTVTDKIGNVLHVHGTTEEGAIIGVNDSSQIEHEVLKKDETFTSIFIKSQANASMGQKRTERAKDVLNKSQIVCIFGMSIGSTDKLWWEELVKWLFIDPNRKLVIFKRGNKNDLHRMIPGRVILLRNNIRDKFLDEGRGNYSKEELRSIRDRIIVMFNSAIFSFPKVK